MSMARALLSRFAMPRQTVAHRPDVDALVTEGNGHVVDPAVAAIGTLEESDNPLGPFRGILLGCLLGAPFWTAFFWLVL